MTTSEAGAVDRVNEVLRGHWVALAVRAAIELGVLDALADRPRSVEEVSAAIDCDADGVRRLALVLTDAGLLQSDEDAVLTLTAGGRLLTSTSESAMAALALFRTALPNLAAWHRLGDAVRSGQGSFVPANGRDLWTWLAADPQEGAIFNAAMARRGPDQARAIVNTVDLRGDLTIVDVGGGRGGMMTALLGLLPAAYGVVADRADVAAAASAHFAAVGLGQRARGEATDFMQSVPPGGDVYVLSNVLHDWSDDDAVRILRTVRTAMAAGSMLLVVEQLLDPDHPRADQDALHLMDLQMLVLFGARERTATQYGVLLGGAGFGPGVVHSGTGTPWQVIRVDA